MTAAAIIGPKFYGWDNNGNRLSGGKVYAYEPGTSTPKATYTDESATTENAHPVVLNAAGFASIYLVGTYKIVLTDASDVEIWTADPVTDATQLAQEWVKSTDATQVDATSFTVSGNQTETFVAGRRVRLEDDTILYGDVVSASYTSPSTTVTVAVDDETALTAALSRVRVGNATPLSSVRQFEASTATVTTPTGEDQSLAGALNDREIWVPDLAGLKGLTSSLLPASAAARITTTGRAGTFRWVTGDQSVNVTADTQEGIWIAPADDATGASGAWERTDTIVTPEMFGAVGDRVADDTAALKGFFSSGRSGRCPRGAKYRFTTQVELTQSGVKHETRDALFEYAGATTTDPIFRMMGGANDWSIDRLYINVATGSVVDRALDVNGSDVHIEHVKLTSDDLQNNRSATVSAAFRVFGSRVSIDHLEIDNFDNGVRWVGPDGVLTKLDITNHVRGVWLDTPENLTFGKWKITGLSPNAGMTPGHNGVLITDVVGLSGEMIHVEDSGEHGVRFSGSTRGSDRVDIDRILALNTGGCGVKFRCNSAHTLDDINIGSIICEDCGDATNPITNQEGLLIERVRRLWIGSYTLRRRNKSFSCHNGVSFFDCQVVTIGEARIEFTNREAFFIETVGMDDGGATIYKDTNDVYIGGGQVMNPGRHVFFFDMDTGDVRNFHVDGLHCRAIPDAVLIAFAANAGIFAAESVFRLHWITAGTPANGAVRGSGINSNVILEAIGDNFDGVAATPKPGSSWFDTSSGLRRVRDGAGNWTSVI